MYSSMVKHLLLSAFLMAAATISYASPLQSIDRQFSLNSNTICPYFSYLYKKPSAATVLLFPDWEYQEKHTFINVGKKEAAAAEANDLYLSGQYNKQNKIIGFHVDSINVQKEIVEDASGSTQKRTIYFPFYQEKPY